MNTLGVLIVGPSPRPIVGGQEVEAELLCRKWQDDPDVAISFLPSNPNLPKWMRSIEHIPFIRTMVRFPIYARSLWTAVTHVEVAHVFSASYTSFLLTCLPAWLISRWQGKRVVLNYHTARSWQKFATSKLVRFVLRRTANTVVPSHYLAAKFTEAGLSVSVVPNIIHDQFRYRRRTNPLPRILCARNLSLGYGIDVIIHSFARVKAYYPDASLYLVGDGPLRRELEAQVRRLELSGVEFCGTVPNEQMPGWYDRADIFLNASFVDNAPLSIVEAMACGLPVVTTAAGGIPWMVTHEVTALIAPVGDVRALAEQVLRLLREKDLAAKIAQQAYEALGRYCWSSVRAKWLEVYTAGRAAL